MQSNKEEFAKIMVMLGVIYDQIISEEKMNIYYELLRSYSIDVLQKGATRLIKERTTASFPKPAEIIEKIEGNLEDKANLAWEKVTKAMLKHGHYQSVSFDDHVIHSVMQVMGGWAETGNWLKDDMKWKRIEFCKLYNSMSLKDKHPKYLTGCVENINSISGHEVPDVIQIGDSGDIIKRPLIY